MKKTLLVTLDYHPSLGGVSRYWEHLGDCLLPDFFIVLAPTLPARAPERASRHAIVRSRMIVPWLYPHWIPLVFAVYRTCRKYHIQRIIAAQVLPVGTAVSIVSRFLGIPYIVSCHGMDLLLPKKSARKKQLCKRILTRAERVIVNSAATGGFAEKYGVARQKIEYIYPAPVITPALVPAQKTAVPKQYKAKKIILTVGRLVSRKGHEYVLRALPGILAEIPDAVYCIIGDGPHREVLQAMGRELHIEHAVLFAGRLSDAETAQWYDACSVFIMTPEDLDGDIEGFGIVYLEAQSFGKPVIGSRTGGVAEAVHDGVAGILVESKDIAGIQNALFRVLRFPSYAQQLGEAGRRRVSEEFQWKNQAEKLQYLLSL